MNLAKALQPCQGEVDLAQRKTVPFWIQSILMIQVRFTHPTRHWRDGSREDADWEDPLEGRVRRQVFLPGVLPSKNKEWSHQPLSSSRKDGDGKPTFHWWVREILIIVFLTFWLFFAHLSAISSQLELVVFKGFSWFGIDFSYRIFLLFWAKIPWVLEHLNTHWRVREI